MVTNNSANFGTGTAGQVLTSNGPGVAPTFQAASGGITGTTTQYDVIVGAGVNSVGSVGPGTAGQVLQSGGNAANPSYSTPTYPSASGSAGQILRADGTNNVYTTATYPNTVGSGTILYGSSSNVVGTLAAPTDAIPGVFLNSTGTLPQWFDPRNQMIIWDDFLTDVNSSGVGNTTFIKATSGTGAAGTPNASGAVDSGHPGILQMATGTTTTGSCIVRYGANNNNNWPIVLGGGQLTVIWILKLDQLSNGTDTFSVSFGIGNSNSGLEAPSGCYFLGDSNSNANWLIKTAKASSRTSQTTTSTIDTSYHTYMIQVNAAATSVAYYIDGSQVTNSPLSTNIPTAQIGPFCYITKSAGSTSVTMELDYFYMYQQLTSNR